MSVVFPALRVPDPQIYSSFALTSLTLKTCDHRGWLIGPVFTASQRSLKCLSESWRTDEDDDDSPALKDFLESFPIISGHLSHLKLAHSPRSHLIPLLGGCSRLEELDVPAATRLEEVLRVLPNPLSCLVIGQAEADLHWPGGCPFHTEAVEDLATALLPLLDAPALANLSILGLPFHRNHQLLECSEGLRLWIALDERGVDIEFGEEASYNAQQRRERAARLGGSA
jgi:hypothetical protein